MGLCSSCCKNSSADYVTPDAETRRRQLLEAAERRQHEQEHRGIRDMDNVKRLQKQSEDHARLEANSARNQGTNYGGTGGLKWQVS